MTLSCAELDSRLSSRLFRCESAALEIRYPMRDVRRKFVVETAPPLTPPPECPQATPPRAALRAQPPSRKPIVASRQSLRADACGLPRSAGRTSPAGCYPRR